MFASTLLFVYVLLKRNQINILLSVLILKFLLPTWLGIIIEYADCISIKDNASFLTMSALVMSIWWWGSRHGALENMEYPITVITSWSTVTFDGLIYGSNRSILSFLYLKVFMCKRLNNVDWIMYWHTKSPPAVCKLMRTGLVKNTVIDKLFAHKHIYIYIYIYSIK